MEKRSEKEISLLSGKEGYNAAINDVLKVLAIKRSDSPRNPILSLPPGAEDHFEVDTAPILNLRIATE